MVSVTADTPGNQMTPETYLGSARSERESDGPTTTMNQRRRTGTRTDKGENIVLTSSTGSLTINAVGKQVDIVLGNTGSPITATVFVDGKQYKTFQVNGYNLYTLFNSDTTSTHTVEVRFSQSGVVAYSYTFG